MQRPIGGYDNIPGAPDNRIGRLFAGNAFSPGTEEMSLAQNQGPSSPIKYYPDAGQYMLNTGAGRPGEIRLKNPPDFLKNPPKAPMAFGGGAPGIFLAQAFPGGQDIGNVGGMMQPPQEFIPMTNFEGYGPPQPTGPSPEQLKALQVYDAAKQQKKAQDATLLQQGIQARNQMLEKKSTSSKPVYLDINAVPTGLESVGAGARLDIGRNQNLNLEGMYTPGYTEQGVPIPEGYTIKAGYNTPSLDVNVNYRNYRRGMGPQGGGGFDPQGGGSFGAEAMYNRRF